MEKPKRQKVPGSGRKTGPEGVHKPRTVRFDDDRWNDLTEYAQRVGTSVSAYLLGLVDADKPNRKQKEQNQ